MPVKQNSNYNTAKYVDPNIKYKIDTNTAYQYCDYPDLNNQKYKHFQQFRII